MQEMETFEDLPAPRTQNLDFHHLETLQVAAGKEIIKRIYIVLQECSSFFKGVKKTQGKLIIPKQGMERQIIT